MKNYLKNDEPMKFPGFSELSYAQCFIELYSEFAHFKRTLYKLIYVVGVHVLLNKSY